VLCVFEDAKASRQLPIGVDEENCLCTYFRALVRAPYVSDRAISGPMDTDDLLKSLVREISPWSISKGK
jgi:hypothetical protein